MRSSLSLRRMSRLLVVIGGVFPVVASLASCGGGGTTIFDSQDLAGADLTGRDLASTNSADLSTTATGDMAMMSVDLSQSSSPDLAGSSSGGPPKAGELAASCQSAANCTNVGGVGSCPKYGATGLGCTKLCTTDADCGSGNWCMDFAAAGFGFLGKSCVRGCTTDGQCNSANQQHCVCDRLGQSKRWCSPWAGTC